MSHVATESEHRVFFQEPQFPSYVSFHFVPNDSGLLQPTSDVNRQSGLAYVPAAPIIYQAPILQQRSLQEVQGIGRPAEADAWSPWPSSVDLVWLPARQNRPRGVGGPVQADTWSPWPGFVDRVWLSERQNHSRASDLIEQFPLSTAHGAGQRLTTSDAQLCRPHDAQRHVEGDTISHELYVVLPDVPSRETQTPLLQVARSSPQRVLLKRLCTFRGAPAEHVIHTLV